MMARVCAMEVEGGELARQVVGGMPDFDVRAVSDGDESMVKFRGWLGKQDRSTHFPSGENLAS